MMIMVIMMIMLIIMTIIMIMAGITATPLLITAMGIMIITKTIKASN